MAFGWLRKIAAAPLKAVNWVGNKVLKPLVNDYISKVPLLGGVVSGALNPILQATTAVTGNVEDRLMGVDAEKRRKLPSGQLVGEALLNAGMLAAGGGAVGALGKGLLKGVAKKTGSKVLQKVVGKQAAKAATKTAAKEAAKVAAKESGKQFTKAAIKKNLGRGLAVATAGAALGAFDGINKDGVGGENEDVTEEEELSRMTAPQREEYLAEQEAEPEQEPEQEAEQEPENPNPRYEQEVDDTYDQYEPPRKKQFQPRIDPSQRSYNQPRYRTDMESAPSGGGGSSSRSTGGGDSGDVGDGDYEMSDIPDPVAMDDVDTQGFGDVANLLGGDTGLEEIGALAGVGAAGVAGVKGAKALKKRRMTRRQGRPPVNMGPTASAMSSRGVGGNQSLSSQNLADQRSRLRAAPPQAPPNPGVRAEGPRMRPSQDPFSRAEANTKRGTKIGGSKPLPLAPGQIPRAPPNPGVRADGPRMRASQNPTARMFSNMNKRNEIKGMPKPYPAIAPPSNPNLNKSLPLRPGPSTLPSIAGPELPPKPLNKLPPNAPRVAADSRIGTSKETLLPKPTSKVANAKSSGKKSFKKFKGKAKGKFGLLANLFSSSTKGFKKL